jgi:hypothetical protein
VVITGLLLASMCIAVGAPAVLAAVPSNDNFADATVIDPAALPFSAGVAIDDATTESESIPCGLPSGNGQTVWYAITPAANVTLRAQISASFYYQFIAAYREDGVGLGGLINVGCASWLYGNSRFAFHVNAGTTYYIQAGSNFGSSGIIGISVEQVAPPANDDLADATPIASLPYGDSFDVTAAGMEPGEPTPSCASGLLGTAWYAFTPATSGSYTASAPYAGFWSQVAVYTGSDVANLHELACAQFYQVTTFHATAGTTYYVEAGAQAGSMGLVNVRLELTPNPTAAYSFTGDPSTFDTVQFFDQSYDPGQAGFATETWTFGDGASVIDPGCCPTHRYAADGDYSVSLAVTTVDGRTDRATRTVSVRTHDIAITKLGVPNAASAGQTRQITVGLANRRYPETVAVTLFRLTPAGAMAIGTAYQSVPVRSGNRTTEVAFSYTFTADDAALGKVSFQAVATIQGPRDAVPGDNQAQSLPTKVNR